MPWYWLISSCFGSDMRLRMRETLFQLFSNTAGWEEVLRAPAAHGVSTKFLELIPPWINSPLFSGVWKNLKIKKIFWSETSKNEVFGRRRRKNFGGQKFWINSPPCFRPIWNKGGINSRNSVDTCRKASINRIFVEIWTNLEESENTDDLDRLHRGFLKLSLP